MKSKRSGEGIFEELARAVAGANSAAGELAVLDNQRRDQLDLLESHLQTLLKYPRVVEAPEARKLLERIPRLRELRNMEEYGSLSLEVARGMDSLWRRLPK